MRFHLFQASFASLLIAAAVSQAAPQQSDDEVAPFVSPDTLVVVRGDLDRIDENAFADRMIDTVKEPAPDAAQRDLLRRLWRRWLSIGNGPVSDFREAGVKRAYWVLTLEDFLAPRAPTGTWVFPIEAQADRQKVIDVCRRHKLDAQSVGDAVAAAQPGRSATAGNAAALPPDWTRALAAGGDAPIRAAIVPTAVLRKSFEENVPSLPTPAGPVPVTMLTRGIEWVAVSVALAPDPQVRMIAQAPDAAAAQALATLLERTTHALPAQALQSSRLVLTPAELADVLKATVAGDQLRWEPKFQAVLASFIAENMRRALRQESATNMRQMMQGFYMYANNHPGQTPPDLPTLIKDQDMSPEVLVDPLQPDRKDGFVYLRPMGDWQNDPERAVLYEVAPEGQNVAFADGHVEWIATRKEVDDFVKKAEARNRAAAAEGKK